MKNKTLIWLPILIVCLLALGSRAVAGPTAKQVPDFKVRVRVTSINGQRPTAEQGFTLALAGTPQGATFKGVAWSAWVASTRAGIEQAVATYNNANNSNWQVVTGLTLNPAAASPAFPSIKLQVESALVGGETSVTEAELFGPSVGLILWKGPDAKIHIDTFTGHGRRYYDKAMKDAFLPANERPKKILFGDRYIGGDNDNLSWKEGIRRLCGLGFNALHPVPANLTATVREAGIQKLWGAVYNPPGYAFNFSSNRHAEFVKFAQDQINPSLAAGWKKEDIGFWVTSDEPGWYYPNTYNDFNKDPNALADFHKYLQDNKLSPQDLGKSSWEEVQLIGRKQYTDLPSRRLFYWSNRFVPWASSQFFAEVAKAYEEVIRPDVPILVNFNNFMGVAYQPGPVGNNPTKTDPNAAMGQHDWLEFGRARGTTSISTEDWFGDDVAYQWSFYASRLRAAAELGKVDFGSLVIPRVSGQRPGGMAQKLLALVGNGAKTIDFFTYGPEYAFPGNCYSENLAVMKPLSKGMQLVAKAEDLLYPGLMRPSEIAILTPQSSPLWDLEDQQLAQGLMDVTNADMYSGRMGYQSELYSLFLALQHSAVPVRFVDEQKLTEPDFKTVKVLYLTAPDLPAESATALLQWVRDGGTLVTVAGAAEFDRYHQPMPMLLQAACVAPATAVRMPLFKYDDAKANGTLTQASKQVAVFGEREKLTISANQANEVQIKATFNDGTPALTERPLGKGRILRYACYPGLSYRKSAKGTTGGLASGFSEAWRNLIVQPVQASGATLPVKVNKALIEAPALYSQAGVAVTLLNWNGTPQTVEVTVATDKKVRRVASAEKGPLRFQQSPNGITVSLPLGDVDVLQVYY
ncbi:hypothetical protein [Hymenobacter jejuensis]|uniref:Beta-galactosidase trimerisation domain-containing protein n=1 Tax=Hymenobacter jejuensis TaxID=2502781 RepID=A0A5B7ZYD4_9BACT|nr:hypothetical protein [Hymenobacter jejuensis]QDA59516.1 hypothetical protein FHG12_05085 [Hymenobacter jejuensis]